MQISKLLSDEVILAELGRRLAQHRLDQQITQAVLADQAGVAKRTVERIEAGASAQISSVLRILRTLELLPGLERMLPQPQPSPIDMLKRKGKQRKRASGNGGDDAVNEANDGLWTWDDKP